jgi:hypothetical protein
VPEGSRLHETEQFAPPVETELLYRTVDALEEIAAETGKTVPRSPSTGCCAARPSPR